MAEIKHFQVNVAGVSHNNGDGSSRQAILEDCEVGERVFFLHAPVPQDINAVMITRGNGEQIGWLHRTAAKAVSNLLDDGKKTSAYISEINKDKCDDEDEDKDDDEGNITTCKIAFDDPETINYLRNFYDRLDDKNGTSEPKKVWKRTCGNCGASLNGTATKCFNCNRTVCKNCGNVLGRGTTKCHRCGEATGSCGLQSLGCVLFLIGMVILIVLLITIYYL